MGTVARRGTYEDVPSIHSSNHDHHHDDEGGAHHHHHEYADVPMHEHDELFEDEYELPTRRTTGGRRRRRHRQTTGSGCLQFAWIYLLVIMILVGIALIGWKQNMYDSRHPLNKWHGGKGGNNNGDDDNVMMTHRPPKDNEYNSQEYYSPADSSNDNVDIPPTNLASVHYDPSASLHAYNPFDLQDPDWYGSVLMPPPPIQHDDDDEELPLGYLQHPAIVNGTLVFCSEGDMYLTRLANDGVNIDNSKNSKKKEFMPAMKLTTTVGNVLSPVPNPVYPYWIAYTATYTGRREVYLLDLRPSHRHAPALRLTYWDTPFGVAHVVGWKDDGQTLVFSAESKEVGLPDMRLYQMGLVQEGVKQPSKERRDKTTTKTTTKQQQRYASHWPVRVLEIVPVPLSQATEGVYDKTNTCIYFTRFKQSSNTIRYVGGTAESLWSHCHNQPLAIPLTANYNGTSKTPQIMEHDGKEYLLFLSDRVMDNDDGWIPSTMNLWAMPLPSQDDLYKEDNKPRLQTPIQLTYVSCEFDGMSLMEYALDVVTNNVILRIGADLHILTAKTILEELNKRKRRDMKEQDQSKEMDAEHNDDESNKEEKSRDADTKATKLQDEGNGSTSSKTIIQRLPIVVYSDFHEHQERIIPVSVPKDLLDVDVYETIYGQTDALLSIRGQVFVAPVLPDIEGLTPYQGAGMNLPPRRYRVAPGATTGGVLRVLTARHVPLWQETKTSARRLAVLLATDPLSETAEHAFYLTETQSGSAPSFVDVSDLPDPFLGGHVNGGSVVNGGLGSVNPNSVRVSPCGRRLAWADTDGRICVMTLPLYQDSKEGPVKYVVLPQQNDYGEPMIGVAVELSWSPGGTYLAIVHQARNQFSIISIADLGNPERNGSEEVADIELGRIVQATPDRFNSGDVYWGQTSLDLSMANEAALEAQLFGLPPETSGGASTLYFLSDRDVVSDVPGPWGTRSPSPHFPRRLSVYAFPLTVEEEEETPQGPFYGGGAAELSVDAILEAQSALQEMMKTAKDNDGERKLAGSTHPIVSYLAETEKKKRILKEEDSSKSSGSDSTSQTAADTTAPTEPVSPFPKDKPIDFGPWGPSFARRAYRVAHIPTANYGSIICQLTDDASLVLLEQSNVQMVIKIFAVGTYPSDKILPMPIEIPGGVLQGVGLSTTRQHVYVVYSGAMIVVPNTAQGVLSLVADVKLENNRVDADLLSLSVWPSLEYHQMYSDAWRMLRDYFYDPKMTGINWPEIHSRYLPLVKRCSKREELDDVLQQLAAELSALHVFVYGGEYHDPMHGSAELVYLNEIASLGATFERSAEWKGYVVTSIPERDPDYNLMDGTVIYSPLSKQMLRLSGQQGLEVGDVIVGVNGESVMRVPDIHMLLRGTRGQSVRLDVLRLSSNRTRTLQGEDDSDGMIPEPVITVPISSEASSNLRYDAWEWKTRENAKELARKAGFSVGYVHLKSMMGPQDVDAFVRGFYTDYDKQALIIDVRHNRGGNIDSWLLDILQRKAWGYWQSRAKNITTGGLGWDEQFAFRGHLVVLIDEKTSSDGEGFSRGVSELGLGKLIGTRTWGGGIWLSSDNHLVDGGIATAPEIGTYNDNFGWGLGIEQVGVSPDIVVDNNPRESYDGKDRQLERAIEVLAKWLEEEPIVLPKAPVAKRDMSLPENAKGCPAQ